MRSGNVDFTRVLQSTLAAPDRVKLGGHLDLLRLPVRVALVWYPGVCPASSPPTSSALICASISSSAPRPLRHRSQRLVPRREGLGPLGHGPEPKLVLHGELYSGEGAGEGVAEDLLFGRFLRWGNCAVAVVAGLRLAVGGCAFLYAVQRFVSSSCRVLVSGTLQRASLPRKAS